MSTALDTNVIIAGLLTWHEHHRPAAAAIQAAFDSDKPVVVPIPALIEAWSVMTRLPLQLRLPPRAAWESLTLTFRGQARLVGLGEREAWELLARLEQGGWIGKLAFDAHILMCAAEGGADELLTFNRRDFERLTGFGVEIVDPRERFASVTH